MPYALLLCVGLPLPCSRLTTLAGLCLARHCPRRHLRPPQAVPPPCCFPRPAPSAAFLSLQTHCALPHICAARARCDVRPSSSIFEWLCCICCPRRDATITKPAGKQLPLTESIVAVVDLEQGLDEAPGAKGLPEICSSVEHQIGPTQPDGTATSAVVLKVSGLKSPGEITYTDWGWWVEELLQRDARRDHAELSGSESRHQRSRARQTELRSRSRRAADRGRPLLERRLQDLGAISKLS